MMKNYTIDGISVNDSRNGKEPLVFVHAFPLSSEMWRNQAEYFSGKYRVITYDVRGLGKSRSDDNQFMMEMYIDDLVKVIQHTGASKVNAVGLSMGGYIIQGAVLKNPGLFKTITLADTKGERDTDEALASRAGSIKLLKSGGRNEFKSVFVKRLINEANYNTELRTDIENIIDGNTDEGICGALLALATRYNYLEGLSKLGIPSLILVGMDDILTPLPDSEKLHSALKNSALCVIENSGHMSNMENPSAFNTSLENFLKENERD